jgi:hypothetical protein
VPLKEQRRSRKSKPRAAALRNTQRTTMAKAKSKTVDEMRKMTNAELLHMPDAEILAAAINVVIPRIREDIEMVAKIIAGVNDVFVVPNKGNKRSRRAVV